MKRFGFLVLAALLALPGFALAQNYNPQGPPMFSANCASSAQFGSAVLCYDTTKNAWYYWSGTAFVSSSGVQSSGTISWDGALGGMTSSAVAPAYAPCKGHFTEIQCTATLTGSCTTGPTVTAEDITSSTTDASSVAPTTTVATVAAHSLVTAFAAGDTIALAQTATVNTCTAPTYHCSATYTCP